MVSYTLAFTSLKHSHRLRNAITHRNKSSSLSFVLCKNGDTMSMDRPTKLSFGPTTTI